MWCYLERKFSLSGEKCHITSLHSYKSSLSYTRELGVNILHLLSTNYHPFTLVWNTRFNYQKWYSFGISESLISQKTLQMKTYLRTPCFGTFCVTWNYKNNFGTVYLRYSTGLGLLFQSYNNLNHQLYST